METDQFDEFMTEIRTQTELLRSIQSSIEGLSIPDNYSELNDIKEEIVKSNTLLKRIERAIPES